MIDIQIITLKKIAAVLARVFIPLKDVEAGEFHFLLWQSIEEAEDDDAGNADLQRDRLQHPGLRIGEGKMPPTQKIMSEKILFSIRGDNLGVTLVEQGERPASGAGVDCLPQPVEYKHRLVE